MEKIRISRLFKDEDGRFIITCGAKFVGISFLAAINLYYVLWNIISLNNLFIESKKFGLSQDMREDFLVKALEVFGENLIFVFLFFIFLFLAGAYIGKVLLRPFELIGDYCIRKTNGETCEYNPDLFSDYKLLSRFSEYFFQYLSEIEKDKSLRTTTIPPIYQKIHKPPFERVFFFHFFILVIILAGTSVVFMNYILSEVKQSIIGIVYSLKLDTDTSIGYLLTNQDFIFQSILIYTSLIIFVGYFFLSFHLYSKISGAIFAFFSTMRAYSKGNYKARVHLIGYAHIRPHGRSFNKYLDHLERECKVNNNKVES